MSTHLLRVLDRAARTALQVLAGYLATAYTLGGVDGGTAVSAAVFAVIVAVMQGMVDLPPLQLGWAGDVLGRAIRTFAQTAAGSLVGATLVTEVPWQAVLSASLLAAVASIVTSIATTPIGPKGTPELVSPAGARAVA